MYIHTGLITKKKTANFRMHYLNKVTTKKAVLEDFYGCIIQRELKTDYLCEFAFTIMK